MLSLEMEMALTNEDKKFTFKRLALILKMRRPG